MNNTAAVQRAIDDRARSMAGMKLAAEKYEEIFKLQVKADKAFADMRKMEAEGTAYEYRGEKTRYIGNAATGSVMTVTTPAGKYKTGGYAQAGLEYNLYKRQVDELKKQAEEYLKFVMPDNTGSGGGSGSGSGKSAKDKVSDLLTLTRELEDAVIANIEDEYVRAEAAEVARHRRFVEDKQAELKLVGGDAERAAVINQQIEEDKNTHDRNMLDIDEKYRQEMIKRIEDQKKRRRRQPRSVKNREGAFCPGGERVQGEARDRETEIRIDQA